VGGSVFIGRVAGAEIDAEQASTPGVRIDDACTAVLGDFRVHDTRHLQGVGAFKVKYVLGDVVIDGNDLLDDPGLDDLTTVEGDVILENNAALARLFPDLGHIGGDLVVRNNPLLPTCAAEALRAITSGAVTIEGNDDAGTCP
jgi:hypothetical protein